MVYARQGEPIARGDTDRKAQYDDSPGWGVGWMLEGTQRSRTEGTAIERADQVRHTT